MKLSDRTHNDDIYNSVCDSDYFEKIIGYNSIISTYIAIITSC